jgi:DNA-binding NarL/FixJ family response regulator
MPVMNGLQATKFLRDLRCRSRIVILTTYEDKEYIDAAFSCGANAFVTKQSLASDLATAIRTVFQGNSFTSPSLSHPEV